MNIMEFACKVHQVKYTDGKNYGNVSGILF